MATLPFYIGFCFILTLLFCVGFLFKASKNSKFVLILLAVWIVMQGMISLSGFYMETDPFPPRFIFLVLPPNLLIAYLFLSTSGKTYVKNFDDSTLTLLHSVRIPVEIALYWLYTYKMIPEIMTFEGRNLDIISGLTAPFVYYFGYIKKALNKNIIIVWNLVCLLLLINIVSIAILSAPFEFQKFAFDQPNIAVLNFPYIYLPCCIVPIVLFSHLYCIKNLLSNK